MARDVSIAISVRDNFTQAITTMKNANQSFNKDLTGLQNKLDVLNKNKITLKVDTDKARRELRETEKAFAQLGEAAGEEHVRDLQKANEAYEQARRNLKLVADEARRTEKALSNYAKESSKVENKAGFGGAQGLLSALGTAGMFKMTGEIASNIASGLIGSTFGTEGDALFSNAISSAMSGAAIGSMIAPGPGTAVGGAIGAGLGVISGSMDIYKAGDEAFKGVVQSSFEAAKQAQEEMLGRGMSIAGGREQRQISFATLLGSEEVAKDYLAEMTKFAEITPFGYDQLANISQTLLAYGYQVDELIPLLTKVGDAGSALSLSAEDINSVAISLGRMQITGQTTMRYLNPLLEKGIPVWDYLAKASGKTKEEVQEMVSKGLVPGAEAAKALADYMGADFAGNMEKQSRTYEGLISALEDAQDAIDFAMGEGYNEERKKGIQAQIDYFEGESGEKIKEANRMIGEWKASLDNEREAAIREAIDDMMTSKDYIQAAAEGDRVTMGYLLARAQVQGENEYRASEGFQLQLEADRALAAGIREDMSLQKEYWNAGYIMGKEFSKGRMAGVKATGNEGLYEISGIKYGVGPYRPYAYGLDYVPYDNFPALLHQGERVLTASEVRTVGRAPNVNITGNSFIVREEADIERISREIVGQLMRAIKLG